jgi:ArsR family transcriptional regulator, arsenate/arsenite/antimonite-responsive transcriptional repressor
VNANPTASPKPRGTKPPKAAAALRISPRALKGLKDIFKLLADVNRLKILLALAEDGEMHVSALCDLLNQTQPAVSHHLTLLRMTGIVGYRRDGKHNFYRLESGLVRDLLEQFANDASVNGHRAPQVDDFYATFKRK